MIEGIIALVILVLYVVLPYTAIKAIWLIPVFEIRMLVLNVFWITYFVLIFKALTTRGYEDGE